MKSTPKSQDLMPETVFADAKLEQMYEPVAQPLEEGEVLLYDPLMFRAHNMNAVSALVYQACDGKTPKSQISAQLGEHGEELLELTLLDLQQAHLIKWPTALTLNLSLIHI